MHIEIECLAIYLISEYVHICFCLFVNWIYLHNFIVSRVMQRHELCSQKAKCIRILKLIFDQGTFSLISILLRAILDSYTKEVCEPSQILPLHEGSQEDQNP